MKWIEEDGVWMLFVAFFILYGLEFIIPLVRKRSHHFLSNMLAAGVLTIINISFTSLTLLASKIVTANDFGIFNLFELSLPAKIILSIVFLDWWAGYVAHILLHKFKWLWKLHSVHHCDDLVDVTTTFRQHPVESVVRVLFDLSGMIILGIPVWILLIYLTLSTIHAQFEHANIQLPRKLDKALQWVFVTPNMHKVHHSKYQHETDSNYSNIFSVWDRLFHTYNVRVNYRTIDYGLDYLEDHKQYSYVDLIKLPFEKVHNIDGNPDTGSAMIKNNATASTGKAT